MEALEGSAERAGRPEDEAAAIASALSPLLASRLVVQECAVAMRPGGAFEARVTIEERCGTHKWRATGSAADVEAPRAVARAVRSAALREDPLSLAACRRLVAGGAVTGAVLELAPGHRLAVGADGRARELSALLACAGPGERLEVQTERGAYRAARIGGVAMACSVAAGGARALDAWLDAWGDAGELPAPRGR